jgi:murein DD-endopeptidase MepM/ murein hydrolase activator NlpD
LQSRDRLADLGYTRARPGHISVVAGTPVAGRIRYVKFAGHMRAVRILVAGCLVAFALVPSFGGHAAGQESLSDLENEMQQLQADLDDSSARIEQLRGREFDLRKRIDEVEDQRAVLVDRNEELTEDVVERARELYVSGGTGVVEALFAAQDFSEFSDRAEMLSHVTQDDSHIFVELQRNTAELEDLEGRLAQDRKALEETLVELEDENAELQDKLASVTDQYTDLKEKLRQERLAARTEEPTGGGGPAPSTLVPTTPTTGKTCPVAGPVSFVDSWGAPRSGGRTHEGTDMMAAYGTPVVAIVSGSITYAGYGGSAGNWQILSGSDGNAYWYMHNQENLVNGGAVEAGQQIATVGDTGNAAGTPHLHFEYHPGGGGPVNPYPLVASIC